VRVLIVMNRMVAGGAETTALELVRALHGRGIDFVVATMYDGGELQDRFLATGAAVYPRLAGGKVAPLAPIRVARLVRREAIDAVIILDISRNVLVYGLIGAGLSLRRVPKILWCHAIPGGNCDDFTNRLKALRMLGAPDVIVCVSRHQRRVLAARGFSRRRMPLIRNGLDLAKFPAAARAEGIAPAGKRLIVQVGNWVFYKDKPTLIRAAGLLARRRGDFHVALVGRGTDGGEAVELVRRHQAEGCVSLLGQRGDVPAVLAAADIFVMATRCEVLNVATLEAMASGLPVVVSDVPGFDDLLKDGVEGLKAPPGDSEALAAALERLLDDPSLRQRLAAGARRRSRWFSVSRMATDFRRLLETLCGRGRKNDG
jgi:glycosyltransferase involved in cell wall biosynthesis